MGTSRSSNIGLPYAGLYGYVGAPLSPHSGEWIGLHTLAERLQESPKMKSLGGFDRRLLDSCLRQIGQFKTHLIWRILAARLEYQDVPCTEFAMAMFFFMGKSYSPAEAVIFTHLLWALHRKNQLEPSQKLKAKHIIEFLAVKQPNRYLAPTEAEWAEAWAAQKVPQHLRGEFLTENQLDAAPWDKVFSLPE